MRYPKIEWDEDEAAINRARHGVDFLEAMEALLDPLAATVEDRRHSIPLERRVTVVGLSRQGRLLRVTVTQRRTMVRIISARRATARERHAYEEA